MTTPRKSIALLVAVFALAATGCRTDDAAEKDVKDAAHDIKKEGKKAADKVDDDDGK